MLENKLVPIVIFGLGLVFLTRENSYNLIKKIENNPTNYFEAIVPEKMKELSSSERYCENIF